MQNENMYLDVPKTGFLSMTSGSIRARAVHSNDAKSNASSQILP